MASLSGTPAHRHSISLLGQMLCFVISARIASDDTFHVGDPPGAKRQKQKEELSEAGFEPAIYCDT